MLEVMEVTWVILYQISLSERKNNALIVGGFFYTCQSANGNLV